MSKHSGMPNPALIQTIVCTYENSSVPITHFSDILAGFLKLPLLLQLGLAYQEDVTLSNLFLAQVSPACAVIQISST